MPSSKIRRTALALAAAFALVPTAQAAAAGNVVPGRYVVVLEDTAGDPGAIASDHGRRLGVTERTHVYRHALKGYAARIPAARLDAVRSDPRVAFVAPDREAELLAQTLPTGVDRVEGDASTTRAGDGTGAVGTGVAVIDTGSGPAEDINVVGGVSCIGSTSYDDYNNHGTHVAGIVAAKDNGLGVVGVAPGAPVYSVRVLDWKKAATLSTLACGVDWVTANKHLIRVANMSLRFRDMSDDGNCGLTNGDPLHVAICNSVAAGVTHVVAAGNEANDFATNAPAAYDEVLTVTAAADFDGRPDGMGASTCRSDVDDTAADFSSFAVDPADAAHTIAAPGVCIWSSLGRRKYGYMSGTSMAAPHVAGAVALCLHSGTCAGSPAQIIAKLRDDAATHSLLDPGYGFLGDPRSPASGRHYGDLLHVGGY